MEAKLNINEDQLIRIMAKGIIEINRMADSDSAEIDGLVSCPVRPFLPFDILGGDPCSGRIVDVLTFGDLNADTLDPYTNNPDTSNAVLIVPGAKALEDVLRRAYMLKSQIPLQVWQEEQWMVYEVPMKKIRIAVHDAMIWAAGMITTLPFKVWVTGDTLRYDPIIDDDDPVYQQNAEEYNTFCGNVAQYAIFGEIMY